MHFTKLLYSLFSQLNSYSKTTEGFFKPTVSPVKSSRFENGENFCYTVPFVAGLRQSIKLNAGIFHRLSVKSSFFSDFHPLLCPLNMSDGSSMCDPDEAPKHRSYL